MVSYQMIAPATLFVTPLLDLLYPRYCLHCYRPLNNRAEKYLCRECLSEIPPFEYYQSCARCGMFLGPELPPQEDCPDCRNRSFPFRRVLAARPYDGLCKELIIQYKYGREKLMCAVLSSYLIERLNRDEEIVKGTDIIVPVPLSRSRRRQRGFNQSELLAEVLSRQYHKLISANNLVRVRETPAQASLSRAERLQNLEGAFRLKRPEEFSGKVVLLVDDVLTTGATAAEISRLLKQAGTKTVYVLVIAR